jgi:hypothetical protein
MSPSDPRPEKDDEKPPTLLQTVGSVLASFFGVQSRRNRERDFRKGSPETFIIVAIAMTALLVITIVIIVKIVLHNAGM